MDFGVGLEEIGMCPFHEYLSLYEISIPPSVEKIRYYTFGYCGQLRTVYLGMGLEEISLCTFHEFNSLHEILVPPSVKKINKHAFCKFLQLGTVLLGKDLEEIGQRAFIYCKFPSVQVIQERAYYFIACN